MEDLNKIRASSLLKRGSKAHFHNLEKKKEMKSNFKKCEK
jgi:hypothetical protein